jgi:hypothetical protein
MDPIVPFKSPNLNMRFNEYNSYWTSLENKGFCNSKNSIQSLQINMIFIEVHTKTTHKINKHENPHIYYSLEKDVQLQSSLTHTPMACSINSRKV